MATKDRTTVQLLLKESDMVMFDTLARRIGANSRSDLIRKSVKLLNKVVDRIEAGDELCIVETDKTITRLMLVF